MRVLAQEELFRKGFFKWVNVRFTYRKFNGSISDPIERIVFERGASVGMLLHDIPSNEVILVEQVRVATLPSGHGMLLEIPAGVIEGSDSPESTAHREITEETGAQPAELEHISTFYLSPGACSERLHLFYAPYPNGLDIKEYAGLADENEDIRVHRLPVAQVMGMIKSGQIADAKTLVALLWLARNA